MPLVDITNPKIIQFLIENYEKENRLRLNWVAKNREKIHEAATLKHREPTNYTEKEVDTYNMAEGMATITRDHVVAGYNKRKKALRDGTFIPGINNLKHGYSIEKVGLGSPKEDPRLARSKTNLTKDPVMRPVDPKIEQILYKSKPVFGRKVYLEKRSKIIPENKYYFSECSYWDYGWRLKDSELCNKPMHGRCFHLTTALRSRVGPNPDPEYYKSSEEPSVMKCTI